MVTCLQQLLSVAKPVAALQIVKERRAVATTEGEGVRVRATEEKCENTADGKRKYQHALCLAAADGERD